VQAAALQRDETPVVGLRLVGVAAVVRDLHLPRAVRARDPDVAAA
jgi:hypothetical protein